jgi:PAS domain S-box-containing protein
MKTDDPALRLVRALIQIVHEPVMVLDHQLLVRAINPALCTRFDCTPAALEQQPLFELDNGAWDSVALRHLLMPRQHLINNTITLPTPTARRQFDCTLTRLSLPPDPSELVVLALQELPPAQPGSSAAVSGELSLLRQRLDERTATLDALMQYTPVGIMLVDKNTTITDVSRYQCGLLNKTPHELIGMRENPVELGLREVASDSAPPTERLPLYQAMQQRRVFFGREYLLGQGEQQRVVSLSAGPILDSQGEVQGAVTVWHDITAPHQLSAQLISERNFVEAVLQTAGALIAVVDEQGRIVRFNRACEQLTGYSAAQVQGRTVLDLFILPEEVEGVRETLEKLSHGQRVVEHENHWLTSQGKRCFIRWRNSLLESQREHPRYIIATGIDITDRKHLEDQLNRRAAELTDVNRELQAFTYSASHDLRGPLHAIDGFAAMLLEEYAEALGSQGREYVQRIGGGVAKMLGLVEGLLTLSRVSRQQMQQEQVDLSTLANRYLAELGEQQPQRLVKWRVQGELWASADAQLISMAMENLLRNAWKFTAHRELGQIEVGKFMQGSQTVFYVRDNGAGFDNALASQIFEPFRRLHAQQDFGGSGIGLSIVQRVINRHGGAVWAQGQENSGATFFFTLPPKKPSTNSDTP